MQKPIRCHLALLAALAVMAAPALHAQTTVANVRAAQRAGTKLVDIDYDLTGVATPCTVSLEISADGGTTWALPATTLTGNIGANVTPGTNLRVTWNAGLDWNKQTSAQTQFRLKVTDLSVDTTLFAPVASGTFTMGNALAADTDITYATTHPVAVSAFYMQKNGVTKADWDAVRTWGGGLNGYTDLAVGAGKASNHPVQTVSWYDALKWCNAKSEMDGLTPCYYTDAAQTVVYKTGTHDIDNTMVKWAANGYRLPTEAEREKAARGGQSGNRFPWGNTISQSQANYYGATSRFTYDLGPNGYNSSLSDGATPYTSLVGSFGANGYGLFDMAGNVWEWCWDWYSASYYGSPASLTDPAGPTGSARVLRGGAWNNGADRLPVAFRASISPDVSAYDVGFRPVRR